MKNIGCLLTLHSINGLGPIRLKALLDYFQDPKAALEADPKELLGLGIPRNTVELLVESRKKLNPEKYLLDIEKLGIKWTTIFDDNYPLLLKQIYDPPVVLYYQGDIPTSPALSIVGTRKVTGYGRLVTEQFSLQLAQSGLVIVSGLARGVDTVAHISAIQAGGKTLAVLGGGLRRIFPPENISLAKKIINNGFGAVLSEFPPDSPSLPGNFPSRNRIISGLSLGVLVTEAARDSGSLITAKAALDQGRDVYAIPGPITSQLSSGTAFLIKQGAKMVTDPSEILEDLKIQKISRIPVDEISLTFTADDQKILSFLFSESRHVDEISRELSLPVAAVSASLIKMEIKGVVRNLGGGVFTKI